MQRIDLNVDLGEGGNADKALIALATSVNISCGGHAGDEMTLRRAMEWAAAQGVAVGAHPGHEDREHFGRRPMKMEMGALEELLVRQLSRFRKLAEEVGVEVAHVKAHGALYHQLDGAADWADVFLNQVAHHFPEAGVTVPPDGWLEDQGRGRGLRVIREGFADRRYGGDGKLVPRGQPNAVIHDPEEALVQAIDLAQRVETLCVHGDGVAAVKLLTFLRLSLEEAGWTLVAPHAVVF
ncbi:UPF0271 protein [Haloferula luteola]|uniref:UPF0271 protein n=1 Tax=Haloferula luteola TaxID=595692 RepID=A0A840UVY0_9BACT|nr:LamB/YcsF family protein [Haloferula luteola]MBB5350337.1 UPF0271 protein [Haloferula luteola]